MANDIAESAIHDAMDTGEDVDNIKEDDELDYERSKIKTLFAAASILRTDMKAVPDLNIRKPSDIKEENADKLVPDSLYTFFSWLLNSSDTVSEDLSLDKDPNINVSMRRQILSLGQDLCWYISGGRKYTPKHIGLALAIKHLTASEKVVALVNKYGHCCAPKTILRFETNLADDNISSQAEENIIIPCNI